MRPSRRVVRAAGPLAVVGALVLTGCSSEPEPVILGYDGSGTFRSDEEVAATMTPVGGKGPSTGTARAVPAGDDGEGVRVEARLRDLDPGTWTVSLTPGTRCSDAGEADDAVELPDLTVGKDGRARLDHTLDDVAFDSLVDGAALVVEGPGGSSCGTLADY
ncbi:hypothetical protein [Nocardioides marmotae]|uniref:hypothetical protein n=1 Tax=Nocardioides marmotae TaxID=2663857 RepID=UPI0012B59917|nr:hypothetical protein [Nocardioides marmotae]MBC9734424.1 hypothetical protein [Nocardioides marmotae]MTB85524.1 hypothetical protein [Nocardioides marmotae]